jgi:hypothetical protein
VACEDGIGAHLVGDFCSGTVDFAVLTADFELEDFVGVLPGFDLCVSHEGDQTFLECAEASLDFAFGLGSGRDQVSDAEGPKGALELAFGSARSSSELGPKRLNPSV